MTGLRSHQERRPGKRAVRAPAPTEVPGLRLVGGRLPGMAPADVLRIQKLAGNVAARALLQRHPSPAAASHRAVVQRTCGARDPVSNPGQFITHFRGDPAYTTCISDNAGDCAPAAKAIGTALAERGYTISYRAVWFVGPPRLPTGQNATRDKRYNLVANNLNHFVVAVHLTDDDVVVIDSTQGQFIHGSAQVAAKADWIMRLRRLRVDNGGTVERCARSIVYADFSTFEGADGFGGLNRRTNSLAQFDGTIVRQYPTFED